MSFLSSSDSENKFSASSVKFTVIDEDCSDASRALIDYLSEKHELVELDSYDNEMLQDNLYYVQIRYILNIPSGYEKNLEKGEFDHLLSHSMRTDSASGYFVNQDISSYINTLRMNLKGGYDLKEALDKTAKSIESTKSEVETIEFEKTAKNENKNIFYFFQYFAYIAISLLIVGISPILISFHKEDLAARVACSSYSGVRQSLEIGLGCITYAIGMWLFLMICAVVVYGPAQAFSFHGLLCMANSFVYTIVIIAITLLVGSFSLDSASLSLVSNVLSLGTSFLCGVFVPLWMLSDNVLAFSKFLPGYWYIKSNNMISGFTGEAVSMDTYLRNIGIQLLFAAAIFSVYLVVNMNKKKSTH
ncbi:MAG: ABC transporter permease [Lachnospiraceae bacterium]|nr:ABC transporter permease [Lachnospiraceae bacterium]